MNHKIKVAVVDDHNLFRQGLVSLLNTEPNLIVVAESSNGEELLDNIASSKPDIVLLDVEMPIMNGFETAKQLQKKYPAIKIIALTMHDEEGIITRMVENGVNAFLLKGTDIEQLIEAIHSVVETGYYFNDTFSQAILNGLLNKNDTSNIKFDTAQLGKTERELIKLLCAQYDNKEISERMNLSIGVIDNYKSAILKKIGARNIAGIVLYAVKNKIV